MDVLVANLIEAYRQSISELEWMGTATRRRALDKLGKFTPKIGYPDSWRDYASLSIDPADLMANVRAAHAFEFHRQLNKIGKPVDRAEWLMTPQTVNAYYNSGMNEIVFAAAILQDPFFNPDRDDAANYGAIGAASATRSATGSTTKVPSPTVTASSPTRGAQRTGRRSKPEPGS